MMVGVSPQAMQPPGECRGVFEFWTDLAGRMGLGAQFPWRSLEELFDYRLAPTGKTGGRLWTTA